MLSIFWNSDWSTVANQKQVASQSDLSQGKNSKIKHFNKKMQNPIFSIHPPLACLA